MHQPETNIAVNNRPAEIINTGIKINTSGARQYYDSGLHYDSGHYYDRWGSNPVQGDIASIDKDKETNVQ